MFKVRFIESMKEKQKQNLKKETHTKKVKTNTKLKKHNCDP